MRIKIIKSYRDIVAICDSDLLGKKFEEGNFQLDIKEAFYGGEEVEEEEAIEIISKMAAEDATFNIVGEKAIQTAIKSGLIDKKSVKKIQNIPFTLVLI